MDDITRRLMMGAAGAGEKIYVEDVFSTYLYTGTAFGSSDISLANGIDLAGEGGLVWMKSRSTTYDHYLFSTSTNGFLNTNYTNAIAGSNSGYINFLSTGLSITAGFAYSANNQTNASWTFRKAAKFFDVVTYVGDGNANLAVSHNLGSIPGAIIVKCISTGNTSWKVYHRSLGKDIDFSLNTTEQAYTTSNFWGTSNPTSTQFFVGSAGATSLNGNGQTYVAYLFAHDAGGFGDSGNDNVVSCGSFTTDSSGNATVNLGWEPQWLLIKSSDVAGVNWFLVDSMRGMPVGSSNDALLVANTSGAEGAADRFDPTATGFITKGLATGTYIYIAIRRGPMKTPTVGTEVFDADTAVGTTAAQSLIQTGFPVDLSITRPTSAGIGAHFADRLRGGSSNYYSLLDSTSTAAEANGTGFAYDFAYNTGIRQTFISPGGSGTELFYNFRRAPGFFDVVAYAGTGSVRTVNHNLGVAPELMIVKRRQSDFWMVYTAALGNTQALNLNNASTPYAGIFIWNNTSPTSSVFTVATATDVNASGGTYIAYLFATCPGVSKVGSYTGSGTTKQIDCGFTAGARFVMIKRTDSTGDWYVWDTARGIISANDPYFLLNSTAAEVTNTDYIDPYSAGFEISSTAPAAINANGGSFIFLAIA